ncbi:MAG: D-Ala-D-Ala carboxypeptidase family metallohydrolase [Nitrosomonadales bacterium]
MNLSPHFTLEELTHSQQAVRAKIDNTPDSTVLFGLTQIANMLEEVRQLLAHPIQISSGFRCTKLNTLIGGKKNSQHVLGLAVDFICPGYGTPKEICQTLLASGLKFDQLICEGTWVHLSLAIPGLPLRNQVLTAVFESGRKTRYLAGLA